jgi:hypothetical protein
MMPVEIAGRSAEFKLFLAYRADDGGVILRFSPARPTT